MSLRTSLRATLRTAPRTTVCTMCVLRAGDEARGGERDATASDRAPSRTHFFSWKLIPLDAVWF